VQFGGRFSSVFWEEKRGPCRIRGCADECGAGGVKYEAREKSTSFPRDFVVRERSVRGVGVGGGLECWRERERERKRESV
jgi:hypothetical protein